MASAASEAAIATPRGSAGAHARSSTSDAATAAWLAAIPCAALVAIVMLVLGPPLGRALFPAQSPRIFLPGIVGSARPEPTEQARYLLALTAPLLGALAIASAPRWLARVPARIATALALVTQLALAGLVAAAIVAQYRLHLTGHYTVADETTITVVYFKPATLVVGALLAAAAVWTLRLRSLRSRAAALVLPETPRRRLVAGAIALAATAIWILHAVHSDAEIANALEDIGYHLSFVMDETFSVLNGRTPLVNFSAQYSSLWPFVIALPMLAFGKSVLTFTLVMCTLTTLALLAIFGVLRRATGSATATLLLYLPLLATALFTIDGTRLDRETPGSFYGTMPLRYAVPCFVAWLTARQLERDRHDFVGAWLLFTVAGLGVLNNGDFGIAALGAAVAALLWTAPRLDARALLQLAGAVAAGVATALALVSLLTLARAGSLPQLTRLMEFARLFAIDGFGMLRIPAVLGVPLLVYLTYVAAIAVATVRRVDGDDNRVLTGMLAWAGVFGLGAGSYYVGRSHPWTLPHEFAAWALALALLTVVAVQELSGPTLRRSTVGALVVLFAFGVAACSLAQTPTPWEQIARLQAPFRPSREAPDPHPLLPPQEAAARRFVATLADGTHRFVYKRGAPVVILLTTGHRIADAYGVVNVSPYTGVASIKTVKQAEAAIEALRRAGGNTLIEPYGVNSGVDQVLARHGFGIVSRPRRAGAQEAASQPLVTPWPGGLGLLKWVDLHHLHPRALR